jgi:leader peptidase (prepilin peptidase)/N-methyltransferase
MFLDYKIFFLLIVFIFGTIIGSFLNVIIYRLNTGRGIGGRSMCFSCNRTLTARELVPLFSFLFQGGRCAKCKTKLSWQYPAVEFLTGIIFLMSFLRIIQDFPISGLGFIFNLVFVWIIMGLLVVITVYDMRHKIIPDQCSYLFAILTFIRVFISFDVSGSMTFVVPSLPVLIAGPALAFPFYIIWLVSNGRWMGLGDAKLSLGLGWFVAVYANTFSPLVSDLSVFLYAFWVGTAFFISVSIVSVMLRFLSKIRIIRKISSLPSIHLRSEIPFAPFLIIGLLIVFLMRYNVASLIFNNYFI